jgi:CHAT domain-containing protein
LACHGTVDPGTFDGLASSRLALWDGERLTARDVFFELNGRLRADLVFLNACASGRFQSRLQRIRGGIPAGGRAVGHCGCRLYRAGRGARTGSGIFRLWLGGNMSKAAALQQAQLKMHENQMSACPISWASYMLIGDYP